MTKPNKVQQLRGPNGETVGSGKAFFNLTQSIKEGFGAAIDSSNLSRGEIAGKASQLLGRDVRLSTIDNYCSLSKEDYVPRPDMIVVVCHITGSLQPVQSMIEYLPHVHLIQDQEALKLQLFESEQAIQKELARQKALRQRLGISDEGVIIPMAKEAAQ